MVPTIDISLIGIVLAIWGAIKALAHIFMAGLNWVNQHALAVFLGSKFWATAFFIAAFAVVMVLEASLINLFLGLLGSLIVNTIPIGAMAEVFKFCACVFPLDIIAECLSFFFAGLSTVFIAENYAMWWIRILGVFQGLARAFKT